MQAPRHPHPPFPHPSPLEATLYFTTWCLSPYYNHGAYNISIIAVAMAKYCYFHGQVHGYYRGLRSQHPSIQPAESHRPTGRTDEAHQREHRRIAARRAVNAAPTVRNTALPPAIKNKIKKNNTKTIRLVSLTDSGGGVDEIQDGGGE